MAKWRYPGYLPKPPHEMNDFDWQSYKTGLSKDQMSERYSGITSDLIPAFEKIQAQGLGETNPDPYKRVSPFGAAAESNSISKIFSTNKPLDQNSLPSSQASNPELSNLDRQSNSPGGTQKYGFLSSVKDAGRSVVMKVGETMRHDLIMGFLADFNDDINAAARTHQIDAGIVKSIIYEEQSHLIPFEMTIENELGIGSTIGAGQITEGMYGRTREELADPSINIGVVAMHLAKLKGEGLVDPARPVASLASRYNNGLTKSITSYGIRVEGFYNRYFAK